MSSAPRVSGGGAEIAWTGHADMPPAVGHAQNVDANMYVSSVILALSVMNTVLANYELPPFTQMDSEQGPQRPEDSMLSIPPSTMQGYKKFTPRKKHLKPKRLLRRMGKDFNKFWMSVDVPGDLLEVKVKEEVDVTLQEDLSSVQWEPLMQQLQAAVANSTGNTTLDGLVDAVKTWLVNRGSCQVYYRWEDMGLLYWPRWVRSGSCSRKELELLSSTSPLPTSSSSSSLPSEQSCSWPPGMTCVPARAKKLKILRWQCRSKKGNRNGHRPRPSGGPKRQPPPDLPGRPPHVPPNILKARDETAFTVSRNATLKKILWMGNRAEEEAASEKDGTQPELGEDTPKQYYVTKDISLNNNEKMDLISELHPTDIVELSETVEMYKGNEQLRDKRSPRKNTDKWRKKHWREQKKKMNLRCKWVKIPYPVTNECYCSC